MAQDDHDDDRDDEQEDREERDDGGDGGRRGRRQGQGQRQQQRLTIQVEDIGEPRAKGDGTFDLGLSVFVRSGNRPAHGSTYQFLVESQPYGDMQMVDQAGRAFGKLNLSGEKVRIAISVTSPQGETTTYPLRTVDLPSGPPTPLATRLELRGTVLYRKTCTVTLLRADDRGGMRGLVKYVDPHRESKMLEVRAETNGMCVIGLELALLPRTVVFRLAENPDIQVEVEVPGTLPPPRDDIPAV